MVYAVTMRYLFFWIALLLPGLALGAVYKLIQPDGTVLFSDEPFPGAEKIDVPPINVYTPPELPLDSSPAAPLPGSLAQVAEGYQRVEIVNPGPETVVRNTTFTVDVEVLIEPPLRSGHTLIPVLDGTPLAPRSSPQFELNEIYRGAHTLEVQLQHTDGEILAASPPVTFYVHQMSRLFPSNPLNPPTPTIPR